MGVEGSHPDNFFFRFLTGSQVEDLFFLLTPYKIRVAPYISPITVKHRLFFWLKYIGGSPYKSQKQDV